VGGLVSCKEAIIFVKKPVQMNKISIAFVWLLLASASLTTACQKETLTLNEPVSLQNDIVPGEYIVILKDEASAVQSRLAGKISLEEGREAMRTVAADLLVSAGLRDKEIETTFAKAIKGFKVSLSEQEVSVLAKHPEVRLVAPVKIHHLPKLKIVDDPAGEARQMAQTTPWGITRVGGPAPSFSPTVAAWIIDTGIDLDHPDLNVDLARSKSFLNNNTNPDDGFGHGTHVAGTIAAKNNTIGVVGVVPGAKVVSLRALNSQGSGTTDDIIEAIDYAAANAGPGDVVNMSLGGGADVALDNAVLGAANLGVHFCIAAGNGNAFGFGIDAKTVSPARVNHPNVYTISAMDNKNRLTFFSNFSKTIIDFAAPGKGIKSCWKGGVYKFLDGTSMACPHVVGILMAGPINTDGYITADKDGRPDPIAHR